MKKDFLFFDLDGTLTESAPGIIRSARYALSHFGMDPDETVMLKFIGPPLLESFGSLCGLDEEKSREAIRLYREYFAEKGMFENSVYDGVYDMLDALRREGKILAVATSKPEVYAKKILDHFHLTEYFSYISGAALDHVRMTKADVLRNAVRGIGLSDLSRGLMIGDRKHDAEGANEVGMETLGVLYGYGSHEELMTAGAIATVKSPSEAFSWIMECH
ncbi:MAG: HAD family hydrolase [Ruminococcaceae bacterium]|nr:HAD family hydrolase [Oscillospiraceae bacterium]